MHNVHEPPSLVFQCAFNVEVAVSSTSTAASTCIFMVVCGHVMAALLCADSDTRHEKVGRGAWVSTLTLFI